MIYELARRASKPGLNWPEGPVSQGQVHQARRLGTSGLNWPEGPVQQEETGPKGQYIRSKMSRRTSTSGLGLNWLEFFVQ